VSFAHGSNDGQKGMGLIMLILIGTVPTAYALNRAMPADQVVAFGAVAEQAATQLSAAAPGVAAPADVRGEITRYVKERSAKPETLAALAALSSEMGKSVAAYGDLKKVPAAAVSNVRNDMYLVSEALRFLPKQTAIQLSDDAKKTLTGFKAMLDNSTKFIPLWVKVAVAIALGLGTMIGWKRIVVTVGEKIGKTHLTYAQGASAELVTAVTIFSADTLGLPVSTTHILSSGVAGAMAANGSGLQLSTVRNLALAWILTLPVAMLLSATLYTVFYKLFA
jgi:inorganic phosphate transporter, PiT family